MVTSCQSTPQVQREKSGWQERFNGGFISHLDWVGRPGRARQRSERNDATCVSKGSFLGPTEILVHWPVKGPRYRYFQKPPGGILVRNED